MDDFRTINVLRDLRNWHPSHDDLVSGLATLASCIKHNQHPLSDACAKACIDALDELAGNVEDDKVSQQKEQAWDDSTQRRTT